MTQTVERTAAPEHIQIGLERGLEVIVLRVQQDIHKAVDGNVLGGMDVPHKAIDEQDETVAIQRHDLLKGRLVAAKKLSIQLCSLIHKTPPSHSLYTERADFPYEKQKMPHCGIFLFFSLSAAGSCR